MTDTEYIKTITLNGQDYKLGLDDYGQCFFVEYEDKKGHHEISLGSYNTCYMEELLSLAYPEYHELTLKEILGKPLSDEKKISWPNTRLSLIRNTEDIKMLNEQAIADLKEFYYIIKFSGNQRDFFIFKTTLELTGCLEEELKEIIRDEE